MSICMAIFGFRYYKLRGEKCDGSSTHDYCHGHTTLFIIQYGLTLFFANFGPNSTTFIVPAEIFPARLRSTCHGISAAAGKAGAIIAAFIFQKYTQDGKNMEVMVALAAVNMIGFFFTFLVPETKGGSLEEISGEDKDFGDKKVIPYGTDRIPESEMV